MARSQRRLLFIIGAIFLGLYFLSHNIYLGNWYYVGHVWWMKWLLLGLGLWLVLGCFSSRSGRRYRDEEYRDRSHRASNREILDRIDAMQKELTELRYRRERASSSRHESNLDEKLADLTERIITLEKIVTDRRYQLDDEIDKLRR